MYATTAANPSESSYACYYDKKRGVYLGDVYSVKWMENSDAVCMLALVSKKSNDLDLPVITAMQCGLALESRGGLP